MGDAAKLGPLAFDEVRQEIYVADLAAGRIYNDSVAAKASTTLVTNLSAPTAFSFESGFRPPIHRRPRPQGILHGRYALE